MTNYKDRGLTTQKTAGVELARLMATSAGYFVHRFPDARSCSGRLGKQPADFLLAYNSTTALIEVKELTKRPVISLDAMSQLGTMTRFEQTGNNAFFIFRYITENSDQWYVASAFEVQHKLQKLGKKSISILDFTPLPTVAAAINVLVAIIQNKGAM